VPDDLLMQMKRLLLLGLAVVAVIATAHGQNNRAPGKVPVYTFELKPTAGLPVLIDPQRAQVIVDEFRNHYPALGSPRILVYVNSDLTPITNSENNRPAPRFASRQTLLDVRRLVARPLRTAGATLVDKDFADQTNSPLTATSLIQNKSDRDAASRIADVVIDVHLSFHAMTVNEPSGPETYAVTDVQLTAVRLSDAKIIGQVSASDLISRAGGPGFVVRNFSFQDISEPTALALMDATLRVGQ
jgi:hypothetical protein